MREIKGADPGASLGTTDGFTALEKDGQIVAQPLEPIYNSLQKLRSDFAVSGDLLGCLTGLEWGAETPQSWGTSSGLWVSDSFSQI